MMITGEVTFAIFIIVILVIAVYLAFTKRENEDSYNERLKGLFSKQKKDESQIL